MASSLLLLLFLFIAAATTRGSLIRPSDLPHDKWVSLQRNVEFLPVQSQESARRLEDQEEEEVADTFYNFQPFVEGESEYDEYQQAWRYLGFMIDCNDGWTENYDDDGSNSWDGGTGEGCHRYLLWAAYVDLDYEGNGIGEYQYWDSENQAWDTTSCNYADNSRCAKMDCHLEDTHWSLLGLFKHKSYDDWMEQLFKHEGFCVWNEDQYNFMNNAREAWPQGCQESDITLDDEGSPLYYDLQPTAGGGMSIGLYTDTRCMQEYRGSITAEDVLGNVLLEGGGSGDGNYDNEAYQTSSLEESLEVWESIFDTWKICHPCVAYDLNNVGYNADDDASRGSAYNTYNYGYDDDQYNNYQQNDFDCYDDADYTNVNQCMKFMAKTTMNTFSFRDMSLASTQGTLVEYVPLLGYTAQNKKVRPILTGLFFVVSMSVLAGGIFMAYRARNELKNIPQFTKQPLFEPNAKAELT